MSLDDGDGRRRKLRVDAILQALEDGLTKEGFIQVGCWELFKCVDWYSILLLWWLWLGFNLLLHELLVIPIFSN